MIILVNGDSHTAGCIPNINTYDYGIAWPRWICESIDSEYINIAEPSSGNEQIFRSTVIAVGQLLSERDNDPLLVLVMWSGFKRYEIWNGRFHTSRSIKSTSSVEPALYNYIQSKSAIESDEYNYYKDLFYMYTLALILESHGVSYVFMNNSKVMPRPDEFSDTENLKSEYTRLYNLYGERKTTHLGFHNQEETFTGYLKDIKPEVPTPDSYWGVEGHKAYANFVQKRFDFNQIKTYN